MLLVLLLVSDADEGIREHTGTPRLTLRCPDRQGSLRGLRNLCPALSVRCVVPGGSRASACFRSKCLLRMRRLCQCLSSRCADASGPYSPTVNPLPPVVIDTNVFVAAGFHPRSNAARVLQAVADGRLCMMWTEETRRETRHVLERIPPLSWARFSPLFAESNRFDEPIHPEKFGQIVDPDDRKFAALAYRAGAVLVTQDDHLLSARSSMSVAIETASKFVDHRLREDAH